MKVKLIPLQTHGDDRGSLVALEEGYNIPFQIKRVYYIFNTKKGVMRGFHAHKNLKQVAIAVRGSCKFKLDNGTDSVEVLLNDPAQGLLIESFIWREMYDFSEDCVLMVLADSHYDENDYVRDYNAFLNLVA
ncbi:WxcM-like domain-containing protein [Escherichia coli]|uniref:WxcM-like domain-containing protein n=1 Tax=Escherichia coli TaxID=562 RepID=A0A4Q8G213_ECOLX|nr:MULTISPECIES: FdtA/QdtA family cupin domain-containing protein [Escherichia]EEV0491096.1 WxcM-like domain-containing protein [Escherichia coli O26]EFW8140904.1 WxcM-like domain-containing protein [Shigella sonnei]EAB7524420.1 WxcM-like domain-containing protein [Escherichia coli]EAC1985213.1 WxcM-like domain-containing protein [Escherichia coli]EEC7231373.1 WxcM-like domain-containing protein [Escherichia coli]